MSSPRYNSNKKNRNSEKHTEIFLEFLVFLNKQIKREKQKREKLFTRESSQQAKEEKEIFLGILFSTTTKHALKVNSLQLCFFGFSNVFQTHNKKARK